MHRIRVMWVVNCEQIKCFNSVEIFISWSSHSCPVAFRKQGYTGHTQIPSFCLLSVEFTVRNAIKNS